MKTKFESNKKLPYQGVCWFSLSRQDHKATGKETYDTQVKLNRSLITQGRKLVEIMDSIILWDLFIVYC